MRVILLVPALLLSAPAHPESKAELLERKVAEIHEIWTEWMGKPPLTYEAVTTAEIESLVGNWTGSCIEDDKRVDFRLLLSLDGTCTIRGFRDGNENPHWYLTEGIILLYEGKVDEDGICISALVRPTDGVLWLLNADSTTGYVEFKKQNQPVEATETAARPPRLT